MPDLHKKFVDLGKARNKLTYKLLELLPEIYEKEIYKKYAATIEEYAGKYAGLSKFVVQKRLRLEKNLKNKPYLKKAVAEYGVHKVATVAKIATPETDKFWAKTIASTSKIALIKIGKEIRNKNIAITTAKLLSGSETFPIAESATSPIVEPSALPIAEPATTPCKAADENINLELNGNAMFLFLKLKKKFAKNLNNKDAIKILLEKLNSLTQAKKIPKSCPGTTFENKKITRYIPTTKKQEILTKTSEKCVYPNCHIPVEEFHHTKRFMNYKNHDSIVGLCRYHHEYAHNGLIENETEDPQKWRLKIGKIVENEADLLYKKYKQGYQN